MFLFKLLCRRRDRVLRHAQGLVYNLQYLFRLGWLNKHVAHATGFGQGACFPLMVAGGEKDHCGAGDCWIVAQLADELIAVHHRHEHIGDHQVRVLRADLRQCIRTIRGLQQEMSAVAQESGKELPVQGSIVRYQNFCHGYFTFGICKRESTTSSSDAGSIGRVTYLSAPSRRACSRDSSPSSLVDAVNKTKGIARKLGSVLTWRRSSKPLVSGMCRSERIRSKEFLPISSIASRADSAEVTLYPLGSSVLRTRFKLTAESSTTKIAARFLSGTGADTLALSENNGGHPARFSALRNTSICLTNVSGK